MRSRDYTGSPALDEITLCSGNRQATCPFMITNVNFQPTLRRGQLRPSKLDAIQLQRIDLHIGEFFDSTFRRFPAPAASLCGCFYAG